MKMIWTGLVMLVLVACAGGDSATTRDSAAGNVARDSAAADSVRQSVANAPRSAVDSLRTAKSPAIRGLYVNRFAAQSRNRMRQLIAMADSTEINAFVIDAKDEFGLNYRSANPEFAKYAGSGKGMIASVKDLLDTLHAHDIMAIARIVVFKDPVAASVNNAWTIKDPGGAVWHDEKGNAWVNPYHRDVQEYNIGVAEELVKLGFDEIQFDYIRFPEPYRRLAKQVFPGAGTVSKPDLLAQFLRDARTRINKLGARSTADIFGLVTTVRGPLEIGQWWEKLAPVTDVLLPMVYPSHYPRGAFGIPVPNADPYRTIKIAIDTARVRNEKLGIREPEHVRPWLQAFSLGKPEYGAEEIRQQKKAVYDAGYDGWILWHPGSKYEPFVAGLEKGPLVSRKVAIGS